VILQLEIAHIPSKMQTHPVCPLYQTVVMGSYVTEWVIALKTLKYNALPPMIFALETHSVLMEIVSTLLHLIAVEMALLSPLKFVMICTVAASMTAVPLRFLQGHPVMSIMYAPLEFVPEQASAKSLILLPASHVEAVLSALSLFAMVWATALSILPQAVRALLMIMTLVHLGYAARLGLV